MAKDLKSEFCINPRLLYCITVLLSNNWHTVIFLSLLYITWKVETKTCLALSDDLSLFVWDHNVVGWMYVKFAAYETLSHKRLYMQLTSEVIPTRNNGISLGRPADTLWTWSEGWLAYWYCLGNESAHAWSKISSAVSCCSLCLSLSFIRKESSWPNRRQKNSKEMIK